MSITWPIVVRHMQKGESAEATLQIRNLNGPGREHFSLTYTVVWKGFGRVDERSSGPLSTEDYLRSGPVPFNALHFVPLAARLHLCNIHTGEPMHCQANALYWAGASKSVESEPRPDVLSKHLRVDLQEAKRIIRVLRPIYCHVKRTEAMQEIIDGLRPGWKQEADELRKMIQSYDGARWC